MAELAKLGRYQLGRVLGKGAMGVVYEGLDPSINRRVAIKTILKNHAIDDDTARAYSERFAREAQAAGRLNHPGIVQVYDFAEEGDVAYLVMEFIQGRELRSYFEAREKFDASEVVRIMSELLDALGFAHEAGVIHRDIKPANIMLDAQRRVKLADFGVARIQDSQRSAADTMVGTPAFMSPEQISGRKIDHRTDLFSAGTILYQLLTGELPFKGEGAWTVAKKIMQEDPLRPSAVVASVSPVFDGIVKKALAKVPLQRFASAKEFAAGLQGALTADPKTLISAPAPVPKKVEAKASEAEVEFWRAIQNTTDPAELEFYLEQFPEGTYSHLARYKIAKLREPLEAARQEAEAKEKREQEAQAREKARQDEEERDRREAEDRARREAAEKTKREAEERALREALEKSRREAAEKATREASEKARRAQTLERLKLQQEAEARAKAAVDADATVAIGKPSDTRMAQRKSYLAPVFLGVVLIAAAIAAYLTIGRAPAPAKVEPVASMKPEAPEIDIERIRRETEERIRRNAEKAAAEKALAEKAMAEKAAAEKVAAARTVAEKVAAETASAKAAAERAAAEKLAAEKAATAKLSVERAAAERAQAAETASAVERVAAEKAAGLERAAMAKRAAEQAAAEKAASEKAAAEKASAQRAASEKTAKEQFVLVKEASPPLTLESLRGKSFFAFYRGATVDNWAEIKFKDGGQEINVGYERCEHCDARVKARSYFCTGGVSQTLAITGNCGSYVGYVNATISGVFPNISIHWGNGTNHLVLIEASRRRDYLIEREKNPKLGTAEFSRKR